MTFKHTKFEDSITMRALEKVAKEKGMFKGLPLNKTASVKKEVDLDLSNNLMKNILNLSAGLREAGFNKYADELETNFLNYKQANTLYEVSGEKGEDLVDAAHPKGSHKLKDVDSDEGVFETIVDQHLKNVKMVNKMPTGKLSNAVTILNAVKFALGQDSNAILKGLMTEADAKFNELLTAVKSSDQSGPSNMARLGTIAPITKGWHNDSGGPTKKTVETAMSTVSEAKNRLSYVDPKELERLKGLYDSNTGTQEDKYHYLSTTMSYSAWQKTERLLIEMYGILKKMLLSITRGDVGIIAKIDTQIKRLDKTFRALLQDPGFTDQDRKDGNAEIDGFIKILSAWRSVLEGVDEADKAAQSAIYEKKLVEIVPKINQLYNEITGAQ